MYIDDNGIHAVGSYKDILEGVVSGPRQHARVVGEDIVASRSEDKAVLLTSNRALGRDTPDCLGSSLTGPVVRATPDLGVDDSAGRPLRHRGQGATAKQCRATAAARARRFGKKAKTIGHRSRSNWVSGPLPAATQGAEIIGVSDAELLALRRSFASVLKLAAEDGSLSKLLLLEQGPTWLAQVTPIVRWQKEVWNARLGAYPIHPLASVS